MANYAKLVQNGLATLLKLGGEYIKDATFVRPFGLNPITGVTTYAEVAAACKALFFKQVPPDFAAAGRRTNAEQVLIRAADLVAIDHPATGDFILRDNGQALHRVIGALLDPTGQYWTFIAEPTLDEDWGDLTAADATIAEDRGDLGEVTAATDFGTLF